MVAEGYMKRHHGSFEDRKNVFGDKEVNNKIPKFFATKQFGVYLFMRH